ncbi:MAG: hypothetical protein ACAI25_02190 [Planctomycetota bacterium]
MRVLAAASLVVVLLPAFAHAEESFVDRIGSAIGTAVAPLFAAGAELRQARFFHPSGTTYTGAVRSVATDPAFASVAKRLEGGVLARMGGGLLKFQVGDREPALPDVPGLALRFTAAEDAGTPASHAGDLDVTFCAYTERFRTLITGIGFLKADAGDFMNNEFFPDVPFRLEGVGDVWLRLRPKKVATRGDYRAERFDNTVRDGDAIFTLEAQRLNTSVSREWLGVDLKTLFTTFSLNEATRSNPWIPLVEIRLDQRVDLDQGQLKFDPRSKARGFEPRGIVTAIRGPVYELGAQARPQSEEPVGRGERPSRTVGLSEVIQERTVRALERPKAAER